MYALRVLIFLLLSQGAMAQIIYGGAGYNIALPSNGGLDLIIEEFNKQQDLDQKMGDIDFLRGGMAMAGIGIKSIYVEVSWVGKSSTVSSVKEMSEGSRLQRDLSLKANSYNVGLGFNLGNERHIIGPLVSIDIGQIGTYTRTGSTEGISSMELSKIQAEKILGSTFMFNIMLMTKKKFGLAIRPYYQLRFSKFDFQETNNFLNPNLNSDDLISIKTIDRMSNFGLQAVVVIGISKKQVFRKHNIDMY